MRIQHVSSNPARRTSVTASQSITSGVRNRAARRSVKASKAVNLTPEQSRFCTQLQRNCRVSGRQAVTAATNSANIMARPDFLELLPMFVQKLLVLDVMGSVAMNSRTQMVPYFKFIAENTKGETKAGDILSSPFANRQGVDPNFTGRAVRNEEMDATASAQTFAFGPILPGTVSITVTDKDGDETVLIDAVDAGGQLFATGDTTHTTALGTIDYAGGTVTLNSTYEEIKATYQYDNETVGHNQDQYGATMGKGYLSLDEFNLVAEAHQLACYWSIYSAFAAQQEYGSNISDMAKEAAFGELTAEINTQAFLKLEQAASYRPQFNWNAAPIVSGSVVPHDYLNMFKLKLGQAAASIYQTTRLSQPNRLTVGTNAAEYIKMIDGVNVESTEDNIGPYKLGTLDQYEVYVCPEYNPNKWVMSCKSNDIRRNSALFGEYMPLTDTDPITLANMSSQAGYATMYAMDVVNPDTVVSGMIQGGY